MPSYVRCPKCHAEVDLPDRPMEKTVCFQCKTVFPVPPVSPPVPSERNPAKLKKVGPVPRPAIEEKLALRCVQCQKTIKPNPGARKVRCPACGTIQAVVSQPVQPQPEQEPVAVVENVQPLPAERVRLTCPSCNAGINVPPGMVGKRISCFQCHRPFSALSEGEAVAEPEPAALPTSFPRPRQSRSAGDGPKASQEQVRHPPAPEPKAVRLTCPGCHAGVRVPPDALGKRVRCSQCHQVFEAIPEVEPEDEKAGPVGRSRKGGRRNRSGPPAVGFHRQRIAILVGAGLGILATFLPWVHAPIIGAVYGTAGDGWITLALFVIPLLLAFVGRKSDMLSGIQEYAAIIPSVIASLIGVWEIIHFNRSSAFVQVGGGLYLLVVAGLVVAIGAWAFSDPKPAKPKALAAVLTPAAERVRLMCPECGNPLQVKAEVVGQKVRCPTCKAVFVGELDEAERDEDSPPPRAVTDVLPAGEPAAARARPRRDAANDLEAVDSPASRRGGGKRQGFPLWTLAIIIPAALLLFCGGIIGFITYHGSTSSIQGRYVKSTNTNPTFGWKSLEFKPNGVLVINDGEFTSTYRVEKGVVIMKAGILEQVGEISGDKLLINKEIFERQRIEIADSKQSPPPHQPFAVGLQAYYAFDGNGLDSSGNGRDLTLVGNPTFAPGKFGQALVLDGTGNQYAVRPVSDSVFNFGTNDFTVQVWVNYSLSPAVRQQVLIEQFGPGGSGPGWTLTSDDGSHFQFYPVKHGLDIGSFTTEIWHHVVAARRGGIFSFFYDGRYIPGAPPIGVITDSMNPLLIGRRNMGDPSNFALAGAVDDVAIWNRALTAEEIATLWNGGAGTSVLTATRKK